MSIYRLRVRSERSSQHVRPALLAFLLGILVAGCGGGGDDRSAADYEAPKITWARFEPSGIDSSGGTAKIQAQVSDASGVAWVRATLIAPDSTQQVLELTWQSGGFYEASFQVPSNLEGDGLQYSAKLSASDRVGNVTQPTAVGYLIVGGDDGPPPPPSL